MLCHLYIMLGTLGMCDLVLSSLKILHYSECLLVINCTQNFCAMLLTPTCKLPLVINRCLPNNTVFVRVVQEKSSTKYQRKEKQSQVNKLMQQLKW